MNVKKVEEKLEYQYVWDFNCTFNNNCNPLSLITKKNFTRYLFQLNHLNRPNNKAKRYLQYFPPSATKKLCNPIVGF